MAVYTYTKNIYSNDIITESDYNSLSTFIDNTFASINVITESLTCLNESGMDYNDIRVISEASEDGIIGKIKAAVHKVVEFIKNAIKRIKGWIFGDAQKAKAKKKSTVVLSMSDQTYDKLKKAGVDMKVVDGKIVVNFTKSDLEKAQDRNREDIEIKDTINLPSVKDFTNMGKAALKKLQDLSKEYPYEYRGTSSDSAKYDAMLEDLNKKYLSVIDDMESFLKKYNMDKNAEGNNIKIKVSDIDVGSLTIWNEPYGHIGDSFNDVLKEMEKGTKDLEDSIKRCETRIKSLGKYKDNSPLDSPKAGIAEQKDLLNYENLLCKYYAQVTQVFQAGVNVFVKHTHKQGDSIEAELERRNLEFLGIVQHIND